jgi:hypothetical protein
MRANQSMLSLLVALAKSAHPTLATKLAALVQSALLEEHACWFLEPLRNGAMSSSLLQFPDRTGFECFVNHVHISDFIEGEVDASMMHLQGLLLAEELERKLKPLGRFRIIVSCDEMDCAVRFHRLRPGELWVLDDLETYREEALLILES